jgi:DNA-binding transcriptional LysR family regulator
MPGGQTMAGFETSRFGGFTIQQIEVFLTVAKHLNYSKAARELYLSQPAVSGWIKKTEDTLGVRLFRRKNRGVELTPEGLELYTKLEHVYQRFRVSVNMVMRDMISAPKFNVGCLNSADVVARTRAAAERFSAENPQVDVYCEMFNYVELRQKLICGELDAIVTMEFDVRGEKSIRSKAIGAMKHYFFYPKAWGDGEPAAVLGGRTMILEVHNGESHALEVCRRFGFEPERVRYVNSYLEVTKAIAAGDCFTIGGRDLAKESPFVPELGRLPKEGFEEEMAAAWLDGGANPWVERFVAMF